MGALIGAVASTLIGKAGGELSLTKTAVHAGMLVGPDWTALVAGALQKDPVAIGKLVLLGVSYGGAIWGRHRADKR